MCSGLAARGENRAGAKNGDCHQFALGHGPRKTAPGLKRIGWLYPIFRDVYIYHRLLGRSRGVSKLAMALLALAPVTSWGQLSPFSGRAGFIYYVEGEVTLRGRAGSEPNRAQQHLDAGQRIRTGAGRAEVILAPGLLLGVGENTEIEMVKPHLSDLRLRLVSGSAALHVVDDTYLEGLSIHSREAEVRFGKRGVYRLDAPAGESLRLKVFDGKAVVFTNGSKHKVKKKWSLALAEPGSEPIVEKFDHSQKGSLDQWQGEKVAALEAAQRAEQRLRAKAGGQAFRDTQVASRELDVSQ